MVDMFPKTQTSTGLKLMTCTINDRKENETLRIMRSHYANPNGYSLKPFIVAKHTPITQLPPL